jgi:hypothetical protein
MNPQKLKQEKKTKKQNGKKVYSFETAFVYDVN